MKTKGHIIEIETTIAGKKSSEKIVRSPENRTMLYKMIAEGGWCATNGATGVSVINHRARTIHYSGVVKERKGFKNIRVK